MAGHGHTPAASTPAPADTTQEVLTTEPPDDEPKKKGPPWYLIIGIALAILLVAGIAIRAVNARKTEPSPRSSASAPQPTETGTVMTPREPAREIFPAEVEAAKRAKRHRDLMAADSGEDGGLAPATKQGR